MRKVIRIPQLRRKPETPRNESDQPVGPQGDAADDLPLVAIVGCPNVGKSVLFNALTGAYVTVSNFPGTTVEVSRGKGRFNGTEAEVVDTPGMYGLMPITEEEHVARRILLEQRLTAVIHVVDAKNLERMLPMTLQLIEAGLPVILDVNLMDEAEHYGVRVDGVVLEQQIGIPVVGTALTQGRGVGLLKERIKTYLDCNPGAGTSKPVERDVIHYHPIIEEALSEIGARLQGIYQMSGPAIGLLLLQKDDEVASIVRDQEGPEAAAIEAIAEVARARFSHPISYIIAQELRLVVQRILKEVVTLPEQRVTSFAQRLSEAMINPLTGVPLLLLSLFLMYEFVGVLGAQTLVGFLEETVFGGYINPWVNRWLEALIPWTTLRNLFGGEYGVITLGMRYAVALILPIVGTFFLAFSVIEDSGYLPRLAMLVDRVFKKIGLNGRAVIPMVLGFGCDTMATIVTRTLETTRERILSTLLLALAIPCSAQLGVMFGLLAGRPIVLALWVIIVAGVFLLVGFLAARVLPGEQPTFYMELPPLRWPKLSNILVKTYTRMEWYFREVFPTFILASALIWLGRLTGVFDVIVNALVPLMSWIGLPRESSVAFFFGFFRRDYGAAGLYDLRDTMSGSQLLVAATTMTIFVPCIAQVAVMIKERGWKTALAIIGFIFPFAFVVGGLINGLLILLGIRL